MDYAIIGSYFSRKMVITGFNIQKSNNKKVTETPLRKVVGANKQSISISLDGYLLCSSFADLEAEVDRLQEALNEPVLKLVNGANPTVYYNVSWNTTDIPRTPNGGGYRLPISLDFEGLESSAVKAAAGDLAWIREPISNLLVKQDGYLLQGSDTLEGIRSQFCEVTLLNYPNPTVEVLYTSGHRVHITTDSVRYYLNYSYNDAHAVTFPVPKLDSVVVGLVLREGKTFLYYNGAEYQMNVQHTKTLTYLASQNTDFYPNKTWELVSVASFPQAYIRDALTVGGTSLIMESMYINQGISVVPNNSTTKTPASLISYPLGTETIRMNNFGASFTSDSEVITFNSIVNDITSPTHYILQSLGYAAGALSLYPYLEKGKNTITRDTPGKAVLVWLERIL